MDHYTRDIFRYVSVCPQNIHLFVGRLNDVFCRTCNMKNKTRQYYTGEQSYGNISTPGDTRKDGEMMMKINTTGKPTDGKSYIIREIFRYVFCRTWKSFITEISRVDGEVKINNTGKPVGKSCIIAEMFRYVFCRTG